MNLARRKRAYKKTLELLNSKTASFDSSPLGIWAERRAAKANWSDRRIASRCRVPLSTAKAIAEMTGIGGQQYG